MCWTTRKNVPILEEIPVAKDFLDVFLKEIEFGIDVPQLV